MSTTRYLAVDLGAESGRVMLGTLSGQKLAMEEIHRFANRVMTVDGHLHWNLEELEREIFVGLEKAARLGLMISGISADSWAVDYVLLDRDGAAVNPPYCYRDARNLESSDRLLKKLSFASLYQETGIQFLPFNTLFQLAAEHRDSESFRRANRLLTVADYFNARFSGLEVIDQSMASTTQLYSPRTHSWSDRLLRELGIAPHFFPRIVPSGSVLGPVTGKLKGQSSFAGTKVVATCSHDTGAAVAAVPARSESRWAYLSSGTWSLLGVELAAPITTAAAREAGFTNEVGLGGTIRFLKNIAGLWLLQECRRAWEAEGKAFTYDDLTGLASESGPAQAHISLEEPRFLVPGDMPDKIAAFCRETGQPVPATPGQYARIILESLALTYAQTLRQLEGLVGYRIETLHVVGGGSRNELLNQLTVDATGLPVAAGPVEATAIGNVLIQALTLGHLDSHRHLRRVVEASFPTRLFKPVSGFTDKIRSRFQNLQPLIPS